MEAQDGRANALLPETVFFYLPALNGGGAELVFTRLSNALVARHVPVQMILNVREGPFCELLDDRVTVVELGHRVSLRAMPALIRHLRAERPKRLISAMTTLNLVAILASLLAFSGTRVVACERNTFSEVTKTGGKIRRLVLTWLVWMLYPFAARVVGNTQGVADDITKTARLKVPAEVIHNPAPDEEDIAAFRAAPAPHPWFGKRPVAIAMGRLKPQKDYDTMLRAMAATRDDLGLIVLGEGPEEAHLRALAAELGIADRVDFAGFRMDRFAYLAHADLFLISSLVEGFPNALIEAVAFGVAPVATDFGGGGAREVLWCDLPEAIVPIGDHAAFSEAMEAMLDTPPQPDAFATIAGRYHIDRVADAFMARARA